MFLFRHKPRKHYRVEHRPGGYQGWRDTTPIRRPNLLKLIMAGLLIFGLCGGISGAGVTAYTLLSQKPAPTPITQHLQSGGGLHYVQ